MRCRAAQSAYILWEKIERICCIEQVFLKKLAVYGAAGSVDSLEIMENLSSFEQAILAILSDSCENKNAVLAAGTALAAGHASGIKSAASAAGTPLAATIASAISVPVSVPHNRALCKTGRPLPHNRALCKTERRSAYDSAVSRDSAFCTPPAERKIARLYLNAVAGAVAPDSPFTVYYPASNQAELIVRQTEINPSLWSERTAFARACAPVVQRLERTVAFLSYLTENGYADALPREKNDLPPAPNGIGSQWRCYRSLSKELICDLCFFRQSIISLKGDPADIFIDPAHCR
ncbi:hypothetical protein Trebr_0436 [Treponema brennaborense DSM 12168]|uniref:Uncharacterized protein n=1 Tax=Treponema brennaborense (strain DSM 12168 / CIP 105900 / DD5/3) TaxID=906968 RepID=F4LNM6_TREBD|nr:hypothetical protein Trebr_0436 [Treponema brennaborense DSM 12168]